MRFREILPQNLFGSPRAAMPCAAAGLKEWSKMKISARNQIEGKVLEVTTGATTAHVRLEIGPGRVITASITNEAVDDLGLKAGAAAIAVIKASDVMIAID
jgi:molybdopterin-binding protein